MRLATVIAICLGVLAVGCGPATKSAAGIVVSVDQDSLTDIQSFALRTDTGETLTFRVGDIDISSGGFPANHLREHMATSIAVAVAYTEVSGERVAVRLVDAPWLQP